MTKHSYEIEIKSLLRTKEKANELVLKMKTNDPNLKFLGSHKQLNHYFEGGNLKSLFVGVESLLDGESREKLKDLAEKAKNFSVRTRDADGKVTLVAKATVDDTTSENGTARLEWEAAISPSLGEGRVAEGRGRLIKTIDELDKLVLESGFSYQAKWSRERSEYKYSPLPNAELSVSIDKNAGYGYLAEFEMVVDNENKADDAKNFIRTVMGNLEIKELPQDRLQRMFDFYNKNWHEYYGTEKTFIIE